MTDVCWGKHVLAGKFDYKKRWVAECFYRLVNISSEERVKQEEAAATANLWGKGCH